MGTTDHERVVEEIVRKLPVEELQFLLGRRAEIERGEVLKFFVDAVFQNFNRKSVSIEDAYCLTQALDMLGCEMIGLARIPLGSTPFADRCVEQNQKVLDGLGHGLKARFEPSKGRGARGDGWVSWERLTLRTGEDARTVTIEKAGCPLEVGTTHSSRTLLYLAGMDGEGVARWAYNSNELIIFMRLNSFYRQIDEDDE